ncbi:MAPEG family protein [Alphaproteobacteria bacterium]|nr:MAPEG family protein [Alphaproteobacteria bacterium]
MALEYILILSFLLVIIQLTIPMLIELFTKNTSLKYFLSSRDENTKISAQAQRANRALKNLLETFPIFIGITLLSLIKDVDNSTVALFWLIFRIIYMPVYVLGINYLRTGIWTASLICLILMGLKFI